MEGLYCKVFNDFRNGGTAPSGMEERLNARALFNALLPVLTFTNSHVSVSIRFFKMRRMRRGVFSTAGCRGGAARFDTFQEDEAGYLLNLIDELEARWLK